jgi:hypothetical protein
MSATSHSNYAEKVCTEKLQETIKQCTADWNSVVTSTAATDRAAMNAAISALYQLLELPEPMIVYCESPWQLTSIKVVLETGFTREKLKRALDRAQSDGKDRLPNPLPILSQNSARLLWDRVWTVLDAQLSEDVCRKLREAKIEEETYNKKNIPANLLRSFTVSQPFLQTNVPFLRRFSESSERKSFAWTWLIPRIREVQKQSNSQLEGVCANHLGNSLLAKLKSSFENGMISNSAQRANGRRTQMLSEMLMLNIQLLPNHLLSNLSKINGERILQFGQAAITGRLKDECDKVFPPEDRELMSVWGNFSIATAALWDGPSSIGLMPFFNLLSEQIPSLPIGPTNLKRISTFLKLGHSTALFCQDVCFVCERPFVFKLDEAGRLHADDGPALAYGDGFKLFSWHGTNVPEWIIKKPESISVSKIEKEFNAEVRRVMIERYGPSKYILDSGAVVIDKDECGVLYRKEMRNDEPIVMVKVRNSTPEPDGTYREYFLRVPPTILKAREAVAWTFDMKPEDYQPFRES